MDGSWNDLTTDFITELEEDQRVIQHSVPLPMLAAIDAAIRRARSLIKKFQANKNIKQTIFHYNFENCGIVLVDEKKNYY